MNDHPEAGLRERLELETARIAWRDLQRFFASGVALAVDPALDLIEVAVAVAEDDAPRVRGWMAGAQLGPVSDDQARAWLAEDAELWAVVVRPWVLVQQRATPSV